MKQKIMLTIRIYFALFMLFCFSEDVFSQVRLPSIISSHMVLQQNSTVKLWGWAAPSEKIKVTVSWNNKTDSVSADNNAKWQINMQTPSAGGPYTITINGTNKIILTDILIGEVWLCSGQSNMEWSYNTGIREISNEFSNCVNTNIRFFTIPKTTALYPQDNCDGKWVPCDSNTLKSFSAVGYYFGKELHNGLNVPVGLINSSWGGTPAEVWTPAEMVENDSTLKKSAYKIPDSNWWPLNAGLAYNAMIAPLSNYNIAGVIWYQGESNVQSADSYSQLLSTMIDSWRKAWNINFPFYYVQIAPFKYKNKNVGSLLRESQGKVANHPNVGMVVITDLVDNVKNIHPQNKKEVGMRLAKWALADTYHISGINYKSPVYKSMEIINGKAIVRFNNAENGLTFKGAKITDVLIAGEDKVFYTASADLMNNNLILWNSKVDKPVAVRYAFGNTSIGNLFSKGGLPVAPFRTDNWSVDTTLDIKTIGENVKVNLAFQKKVNSNPKPSPKYGNGDLMLLTNNITGDEEFGSNWLGWQQTDIELVLDLGKIIKPKSVKIASLYDPGSWILHPKSISCLVSEDGLKYREVGTITVNGEQKNEEFIRKFIFNKNLGKCRYIKFIIIATKTLPSWHASAGGGSWVFIDEIIVK